ncbi:MAG: ASPIC/UnbV domain-containing protein, partial [Acidobacteria bacterium]|nr:ASPIC/UnbV domain-containing protein [Acidobacteriota bacterium]
HAQEPNRLFKFTGPGLGTTFRARLEGNGRTDSKDAIGARAYVQLPPGGRERRVFRTVLGGSAFSAENELTLTFGLGRDTMVSRLAVLWPASGCLQIVDSPPQASGVPLQVKEGGCWTCSGRVNPVEAWLDPEGSECVPPPPCRVEGAVTEGFRPVPWTRVLDARLDGFPMSDGRSWSDGRFFLEHPFEPGVCRISIVEPFGYLPVNNPAREIDTCSGTERIDWILQRAPEGHSPRGPGYWQHQAKALLLGKGRAQESPQEIASWMEAIGLRYPGLREFESLSELAMVLDPAASISPVARLRRNLAVTLLNLASKRLSSYTVLATGESVGDLAEAAYRTLEANGEP